MMLNLPKFDRLHRLLALALTTPIIAGCAAVSEPAKVQDPCALVQELSWRSIGDDRVGFTHVWPDGEAADALWNMGLKATPCLVSVLEDTERGVPAHVILTHIYHRDRIVPHVRTIHSKSAPTGVAAVIQTVNGLSWRFDVRTQKFSVEREDLRVNAARWKKELKIK